MRDVQQVVEEQHRAEHLERLVAMLGWTRAVEPWHQEQERPQCHQQVLERLYFVVFRNDSTGAHADTAPGGAGFHGRGSP